MLAIKNLHKAKKSEKEKEIEYRRGKWKDDKVLSKGTLKFSGTLLGLPTGKDTWYMNIKKLLKSQPTKLTIELIESEYYGKGGYKHGQVGGGREKDSQNGNAKLTLEEIVKQLGTSKTNLTRALRIERNLTDSMKELLDSGVITKTLANDTIAFLSESEQEELLKKLDITQKITKREVQQNIDKIKQLETINNQKVFKE